MKAACMTGPLPLVISKKDPIKLSFCQTATQSIAAPAAFLLKYPANVVVRVTTENEK